ncbi:MAG: hypothetical protein M1376_19175 [Planctomycetes bacterium]|nr:hypothetical protein [Planctomycetota bacterium]
MGLLLVVVLAADSAFADLMVQPLLVRMTVQPGRRYTRELKLENSDPQVTETITVRLAELTQKSDASWTELKAGDPNLSTAVLRSCQSWLTVPADNIAVPPYQIKPFTLQLDVPAGTRGFFFAAIVATTASRPTTLANGVVTPMNMEVVVPVIVEVQSAPVPRRIELTDVGLDNQPAAEGVPATTNLTLDVANSGGSFSRLLPIVRLWGQSSGHWQKMADLKFKELAIMPGAKLHMHQDAGQPLASGNYRLEGFLFVDGQRGARIQKDVQFKGDPRAANLVGLAPMLVQPSPLFLEMIAGATRSAAVTVLNGSEEEITVAAEVVAPEHMQMASNSRGVRGEELSCNDWVTLRPAQFTLKGHGRQNLAVVAKMPKDAGKYPSFYGTLRLRLSYADGKLAGTKDSWICLQNKPVTGTPVLSPNVLTVSESSASRYLVTASYQNAGETHAVSLACQGVVSIVGGGGLGSAVYKRFQMTSEAVGQTGILLPFETRTYSGILDISDVPPGEYYVTSVLRWPGSAADGLQQQVAVRISEQGGRKVARMTTAGGAPTVIKMM